MAELSTKLPIKTEKGSVPAGALAHPGATFENLRREIDRVFESFNWGPWGVPFARGRSLDLESAAWNIAPAVDVSEKGSEYEITTELPGLDEKNVEVKLSNGTLTIKGEKKEEREEKQKNYQLSERSYGSFTRSFQLPEGIDASKIEAKLSKGVLTVKLPKSPEAKKKEKTIDIKAS